MAFGSSGVVVIFRSNGAAIAKLHSFSYIIIKAVSSFLSSFVSSSLLPVFVLNVPLSFRGDTGQLAVITALSYVYCDFWLWTLHCFLDRVENLDSKFMIIQVSAFDFQEHHE